MIFKPGIKLIEEVEGDGVAIKNGHTVTVKLNAWLNKGQQIQKEHIELIKLAARGVIPGFLENEIWLRSVAANPLADIDTIISTIQNVIHGNNT